MMIKGEKVILYLRTRRLAGKADRQAGRYRQANRQPGKQVNGQVGKPEGK